jgi:3-oxoacyl-[acyl-carrier protein] reductase
MVSSTAVGSPAAATASYVAAKAAAEAWTMAMAEGFRQDAQGPKARRSQHGAAVVFVVKALVDAGMRSSQPERKFPRLHGRGAAGPAAVGLFAGPPRN